MLDVADLADTPPTSLRSDVMPSNGIRRIALIYDAKLPFDRNVMSGVANYVRESRNFNIYIEENPVSSQKLPYLKSWHGDGILAGFDDPEYRSSRIPFWRAGGRFRLQLAFQEFVGPILL